MDSSFGKFLKQKRQEKNFTQKELAKLLYVSESAVSKWEKDVAHPDITLLPKLAELLDVSEHELITASVDNKSREEKAQAKKWRTLSFSWSLFFYISYTLALIPCFICNIAINKTLSWFWIVLFSLLLSFTFTNLPKIIKKHKLILLPLSHYLALCLLLASCVIYTNGNWFWIASLSVLLAIIIIFTPIYIKKYEIFAKIRKFNDIVTIGIGFIFLNILLVVIDFYTIHNNYSSTHWFLSTALPITLVTYLILNLFLSIRFLKINKFLKTSIILFLFNIFTYLIPPFIKVKNLQIQQELNDLNIFNSDFSNWNTEIHLESNIHCIIFLTIAILAITFLIIGLLRQLKNKNKSKT